MARTTNHSNRRLLIRLNWSCVSYRRESRTTQIQTQDGVWLGLHFATTIVIKKFATDKGNANKELMLEAFEKDTGVNLELLFDTKSKSPITDVADAYFVCKYQEK